MKTQNNKIFILLPDGIGLRNFAYSGFYEKAVQEDFDLVFWNNTRFDLDGLGFPEIKIVKARTHPLTDIYKVAKIHVELNLNIKKTGDKVYETYRFPFSYSGLKKKFKSLGSQILILTHTSAWGLERIRNKMKEHERKTLTYFQCLATLKKEQPAMIFCTNQRHVLTIAPLLAAKDLGIPTATFIYSWDNLPKATMCVETDYYFVWSEHMKNELLFYYSYIRPAQIFITGTPQFEMHFNKSAIWNRTAFFSKYDLDPVKKYICFTGDDITTSPDDPLYLEDAAQAILELNKGDFHLGLIFRRCPVDFSNRYDSVLAKYSDLIVQIDPLWKPMSSKWNDILPTKEDDELFTNLAEHTEMVINLGSSTVFDFVSHKKPCGYFRYNQKIRLNKNWDIFKCYRYVHFRSMPSASAVLWFDNPKSIGPAIANAIKNSEGIMRHTQSWFEKINQHPPTDASSRILAAFRKIISERKQGI